MRCFRVAVLMLVSFFPFAAVGLSQEPAAKLPDDGWWARYYITMKSKNPRENVQRELDQIYTYSLVGNETHNGEKYRWVEIRLAHPKGTASIHKVLISEKGLLESHQPSEHVIRGWVRLNTMDTTSRIVAFKPDPDAPGNVIVPRPTDAALIVFPGIRQKFKKNDQAKTVDYQQGRLTIPFGWDGKVAGRTVPFDGSANLKMTTDGEFTVWIDPLAAPGFAAAHIHRETRHNDRVELITDEEWMLQDVGTNAKSSLPDHN